MDAALAITPLAPDTDLLSRVRSYLTQREQGLVPSPALEDAWTAFYECYSPRIRAYAFSCGAGDEDIADCVQEVWREMLVRLPTFQLDSGRGRFDTWLFCIVRAKATDLRRSSNRRLLEGNAASLETATDNRAIARRSPEAEEMVNLIWDELSTRLSECNLQVLKLRLVEKLSVAEVAKRLGITNEQVWYRFHRARRVLQKVGSALINGRPPLPHLCGNSIREKDENEQEFAQGRSSASVSRNGMCSSFALQGGNRVDYIFQRLELGRRELTVEWKVDWNCDGSPRPVLHIRQLAIVAYAEICGSCEFINTHWPRIVNAAVAAGVAAGIATIIATPTAALPIFQTEFHKQLQGKGGIAADERIHIALSARQEPNCPWCVCKD
jgi:RNA polymerase sigma factor (sigma-70 family)